MCANNQSLKYLKWLLQMNEAKCARAEMRFSAFPTVDSKFAPSFAVNSLAPAWPWKDQSMEKRSVEQ